MRVPATQQTPADAATVWRCGGRQCPPGECDHEEGTLHRHAHGAGPALAPRIVHDVLRAPGTALPDGIRQDMEERLGHSFADVRIHTDAQAGRSANAVHADAYTVGRHVVFAPGTFSSSTAAGRQLLAHELAHASAYRPNTAPRGGALRVSDPSEPGERHARRVAQQQASDAGSSSPSRGARPTQGTLWRQSSLDRPTVPPQPEAPGGTGAGALREDDPRLDDPGFLICLAFCYLGVPPSTFKDLVQGMLECLSEEMRAADSAHYERNFAAAREDLATYSKLRLLGKIFRFLMHGELGPMGVIRVTARTAPIRDRLIARLVAMGATHAGLIAAEAVVRKVLLVIDAVIVAGCATYCGAVQVGRMLVQVTEAIAQGFAGAMQVLSGIREAAAGVLVDAVLSIYGQGNPANWVLSPTLPALTRTDLSMLGMTIWAQVRPGSPWTTRRPGRSDADQLLINAGRTLTQYRVPRELMVQVAAALQRTISATGGSARVDVDDLMAMSYIGLIAFLRDAGLLSFRADPIAFARADLDAPDGGAP